MSDPISSFAYKAQSAQGQAIAGTIECPDPLSAGRTLEGLGLRVLEILPAAPVPRSARPLKSEDFHALNLQLAQLTSAGLPLEQGLRLVARDMRRGRLASAINDVAGDLEKGIPLSEAFDRRRGRFPMLYGRLVDAGVRMGNLPGVLLSLGEHVSLVQRLRATLWSVLSYPAAVLLALSVVVTLLQLFVQPQMTDVWRSMKVELPESTLFIMAVADCIPWVMSAVVLLLVAFACVALVFRLSGKPQTFVDYFIVPLPLIGPIIRRGLLARWCDAVAMGVQGGQDLPGAISLASDAIASPRLAKDARLLIEALNAGQPLDGVTQLDLLPATIPAAIQLGSATGDLATILRNLSGMYQRQAEYRAQALPAILTPILLLILGAIIAIAILGLFAPLIGLFQALTGVTVMGKK